MAEYHVGAGEISGEIYAGTLSNNGKTWRNRSVVTDEAICAVRDHLINQMTLEKQDWYGYEWSRKDGRKVVLSISVK